MGWEFLLLGLIADGVRGFYTGKGTNQKGSFNGGKMTPEEQADFAKDKKLAAAGDADAQKRMEAAAAKANAERLAGGANSAVLSKLDDKNLVSLNKAEKDQVRKLNENSSVDELDSAIRNMGIVDVGTFDNYVTSYQKIKGDAPVWNEYFRQLAKITDMDDPADVKAKVKQTINRAKEAGKFISNPDPEVARAASKLVGAAAAKNNPQQFYRDQGRFYQEVAPKIIQRFGDIRLAQLKKQETASSTSGSTTGKGGSSNIDTFDLDSLF